MKILGILLVALVAGVAAAVTSLASGGTVWAALFNYIGVGMAVTLLGVIVVIWRAWVAEGSSTKLVLGSTASVSE